MPSFAIASITEASPGSNVRMALSNRLSEIMKGDHAAQILFCIAVLPSASPARPCCRHRGGTQPKRYALKGKVVAIDRNAGTANVDTEAIPGFME
jgi:hypothetical protein